MDMAMTLREAILATLNQTGSSVSRSQLLNACRAYCEEGVTDRAIRREIARIVKGGVAPIIALRTGGYKLARRREEVQAAAATLQSYIEDLEQRRKGLLECAQRERPLFGEAV